METSRERIRKVLNHQKPDRLAIDFCSSGSTGISSFCYDKLKQYTGIDAGEITRIYDLWMMQSLPSFEMIERFGGDIIQVPHLSPEFNIPWEKGKKMNIHGTDFLVPEDFSPVCREDGALELWEDGVVIARMPAEGYYFDCVSHPYQNIEETGEINELDIQPMPEREIAYVAKKAEKLYQDTDKALMYYYPRKIFEDGIQKWGFENFLVQMVSNEKMVHRYFERLTKVYLQDLERILSRISPYVDLIRFVDDLGSQNAPMISTDMYRAMIKPYHENIFGYVREHYPKVKVALHCCGSIKPLINDLISAGVQVLNPVQISAKDMDPGELKEQFGKDIVFWGGGANMQFTAERGSLEDLKKEVGQLIEIFQKDGGFIFSQVHAIQGNVAPEKVEAIYDTALQYRG